MMRSDYNDYIACNYLITKQMKPTTTQSPSLI